ncbi:hypothetical protein [Mycolicibacterium stellerae]|uniref:hypothetical protein n=1 Tax=Mycolicibacterium stellerae TaxID=2358193 RepID=UPI000F0B7AF1|nr:hypothetical protein [Mycolicibacterium stellerae]
MLEAHNGAVLASQVRPRAARSHAHMWWGVLMLVLVIAGIAAVAITAAMGLTTEALIIAIFTGAFVSRCAC